MPHDSRNVSEDSTQQTLGSLGGCLVEGDPEQRRRERRVRRRALATSILIQTAVLALLLLLPLFAKTQHLAFAITTPLPPYGHPGHPQEVHRAADAGTTRSISHFTFDVNRPIPLPTDGPQPVPSGGSDLDSLGIAIGNGPGCVGCIDIGTSNSGPRPPQPSAETPARPRVIREPSINPAMLIHRVEPVYPTLPRQIHKEGRVELHARIATDGTIQALEIVSGDPMFYESAKQAVLQWRYRPTVLNGQPVEIDTYITVVYTMSH